MINDYKGRNCSGLWYFFWRLLEESIVYIYFVASQEFSHRDELPMAIAWLLNYPHSLLRFSAGNIHCR